MCKCVSAWTGLDYNPETPSCSDHNWLTWMLTLCMLGDFSCFFSCLLTFQNYFIQNFFQEHYLSVKQFGSRSGRTFCRSCSGSKQFTNDKKSPLARKEWSLILVNPFFKIFFTPNVISSAWTGYRNHPSMMKMTFANSYRNTIGVSIGLDAGQDLRFVSPDLVQFLCKTNSIPVTPASVNILEHLLLWNLTTGPIELQFHMETP